MEQAIDAIDDLTAVSTLLEGASLEAARLVPLHGQLGLEATFMRACPELRPIARRGILTRPKALWSKCCLTLNHVVEASIQHLADPHPTSVPMLHVESAAGGSYVIRLTSPEAFQLVIRLEALEGRFADVGQPIEAP